VAGELVRVEYIRSGGVAGVTLRGSVDTSRLPADEARRLTELVDAVDFAALVAHPPAPARVPDRFQYDLVVERGPDRYELALGESQVPPELRPLLDRMTAIAKGS